MIEDQGNTTVPTFTGATSERGADPTITETGGRLTTIGSSRNGAIRGLWRPLGLRTRMKLTAGLTMAAKHTTKERSTRTATLQRGSQAI